MRHRDLAHTFRVAGEDLARNVSVAEAQAGSSMASLEGVQGSA